MIDDLEYILNKLEELYRFGQSIRASVSTLNNIEIAIQNIELDIRELHREE